MTGSPSQTDIWAKLKKEDGNIVAWHPLLAHSADVAAVFYYLITKTVLRKRFAYAAGLEDLTHTHAQRLTYLAAMHDIGKTCSGFQRRAWRSGTNHLTPLLQRDYQTITAQLFDVSNIASWFSDNVGHWITATIAHHGGPLSQAEDVLPPDTWGAERQDALNLSHAIRSWFSKIDEGVKPFPDNPFLHHLFNGTLTLSDWIGSDERFFGFNDPQFDIPSGAMGRDKQAIAQRAVWAESLSLKRAGRAVRTLGLNCQAYRKALPKSANINTLLGKFKPYGIQKAVDELDVMPGGSVTILESDTGSGKTEAAAARYLKLYQAGEVDGLYFAVPTRSAATELHTRITEALKEVFPKGKAPMVAQAVPGQAKADHNVGIRISPFDVDWKSAKLQHRNWAAEGSKKYLAAPVAVGTIDQAFMSVLKTRHAHMRSSALSRHLLVVDEVHSSDTYMTELQSKVVENQLATGGHVLLMSATLGSEARHKLLTGSSKKNSSLSQAKLEAYPLLSWTSGGDREQIKQKHGASSGKQKTVKVQQTSLVDKPKAIAKEAVAKAKAGAKVLIIRNKVADCVDTHAAVETALGPNCKHLLFEVNGVRTPHHSRYSGADRRLLDTQIEKDLGKGSTRFKGKIIVATSTVEQSLDIDADVLYTDLCPMDVLLQRIGRVHRHTNPRPVGFEKAQVYVLTDGQGNLVRGITEKGTVEYWELYAGIGNIHSDLRTLEATRRLVALNPTWRIPRDNRHLVEGAMHSYVFGRLEKEDKRWKAHSRRIRASLHSDKSSAKLLSIDFQKPYGELLPFSQNEKPARTRLGIDNYDVIFEDKPSGPFGKDVYKLSVPGWWLPDEVNTDTPQDLTIISGGFNFSFCGRSFQYNRFGLQQIK